MNEFNQKNDELIDALLKQSRTKVPEEARDKSLLAFQKGLYDGKRKPESREKPLNLHRKISGVLAGVAVVAISGLLFFNTEISESDQPEYNGNVEVGGEDNRNVQPSEKETEETNLVDRVLDRPTFNYNDLNRMPTQTIFDNKLEVHLPSGWEVSEFDGENEIIIRINGNNGKQMRLLLFDGEYSQEQANNYIQELTADFQKGEEVTIPVEEFIDSMRMNNEVGFPYPKIMPFETDNAKISVFYDEETGKFMEMYISELFGYPMIFTSDIPFDDEENGMNPLIFFSHMYVNESPFYVQNTEGDMHPIHERPVEKSVILRMGATGMEKVDVKLYENEELDLTSYLPINTNVERIEYDYFIEWRFKDSSVSKNSYYSFGKLKDGFPLNRGKEIMSDALSINPSYFEVPDGGIPYHYTYTGGQEAPIDGFFELFEVSGEWYFKHKYADRTDYNSGIYFASLEMFVESIEWY